MSRFKVGDRVSFLDLWRKTKTKGEIKRITGDSALIQYQFSVNKGVNASRFVSLTDLKKLKPKKPRRECWVVYAKDDNSLVNCFTTKDVPIAYYPEQMYYFVHMIEAKQ